MNATATAPVDSRRVANRRKVHYENFDELLADAIRLVDGGYQKLGNWSLGQATKHIAKAIDFARDGTPFKAPWIAKVIVGTFLRKRFLTKSMPAGFQMPKNARAVLVFPEDTDDRAGVEALRLAIERFRNAPEFKDHMMFGKLTRAEWEMFNCRHAELHMSFLLPA